MSAKVRFLGAIFVFILAGCQTTPPVPTDRYYRLEPVAADPSARTILNEALYVAPLRADGQYAERAMLYGLSSRSRELQQYHYQHWSEPPAVLLQEHMRASLQAMAVAPRVTDSSTGSAVGYLLNAKILRLEKLAGSDNSSAQAVVSLHITLHRKQPFGLMLERSYVAEEMVFENTQHGYVLASEAGLKKIYLRFAEDIKSIP